MNKQDGLSEGDPENLEIQLNKDSKDLELQFTLLVLQVQGYLQKNSMCDYLRTCLMCTKIGRVEFKENSQLFEFKSAKTIGEIIFILLQKKSDFFPTI